MGEGSSSKGYWRLVVLSAIRCGLSAILTDLSAIRCPLSAILAGLSAIHAPSFSNTNGILLTSTFIIRIEAQS
ncbi:MULTISPECIES: hypothetical protein [Lysinibacillus]|uniref:hypothetical protein n=1 Tax=Lysinibacillus TaxID=400634 RepID=UPI001112BBC2|nr:hypothetical protein [Lysinibacillus xylanilyticus]